VAIADLRIERAEECAKWLGMDYRIAETQAEVHDAIRQGKVAVCADGNLVAQCELMDVLLEATSSVGMGGQFAAAALTHRKHVLMMNAEADLTYGPYLMQLAHANGVVYSSCDGDQPVVIRRLLDNLELWGFEVVMAGNIKGYMDRYINPTTIIPEADKRNLDYRMCASYTDGSKLCVEMALVANACGMRTAIPGMHGPRMTDILEVFDKFDFASLWQNKQPVVDYVLGARPTGGVFAVGYTADKFQRFTMDWFPPKLGPGPFYVFYRPYHLGHIEALTSVAEAVFEGRALLEPLHGFQTNVFTYAKRDLRAGEVLDGLGGYACYGLIENCDSVAAPGLPICLADNVTLRRDVRKDERIALADVTYDATEPRFEMFHKAIAASDQLRSVPGRTP
jgi:predicted homoserine dehydrogenase-like protein